MYCMVKACHALGELLDLALQQGLIEKKGSLVCLQHRADWPGA